MSICFLLSLINVVIALFNVIVAIMNMKNAKNLYRGVKDNDKR